MKYFIINLCLLISYSANTLFAQNLIQTIRGKVTDADTGQALAGATLQILETNIGTIANAAGDYRLENVPVGRYQLQVRYVGYQTLTIAELLVESGRELVQNIELTGYAVQVGEIVVQASRNLPHPVSVKTLTIEEVLRFPATFYDPARLATALPGVVGDNDQANGIAVRGNSPNGLLWRLEGVDIVNPNHTPNAGTSSDRVTANGGGVNILSAQMLGTSTFYTGAFPPEYGNALSAVMDMRLRTGNDEQSETIAQIGLIGLDVAHEGPFAKKGGASYLFNARYSTIGLLGALGANFGDEQISFYDLSFNFNFPFQNGTRLTFFGLGGNSENSFEAQRDSAVWEFQKDRFDINFKSSMGALGATYTQPIGKKMSWRSALAYSILDSERTGDRLNDSYQLVNVEADKLLQSKLSLHTSLAFKQSARSNWQLGVVLTRQDFEIESAENQQVSVSGQGDGLLLQPYFTWRYQINNALTANVGLHLSHFTFNTSTALEPRASLRWVFSEKRRLSLAYGLHSQLQQPQLYFVQNTLNENLDFTKSHHVVLAYLEKLSQASALNVEVYYQYLFDIPIAQKTGSAFSALNLLEGFINESLINEGTGENYGIELGYQQFITNDFYLLTNATFYESTYTGSDGITRDTRWNGNYIFNITTGKEWRWVQKEGSIKAVFGANARIAYIGGFRDTPIDAQASRDAGKTVYIENESFTIQQKAYFRSDLRFYYKRNKAKYSTTLALDIQNATNAQNIAFSYYDIQKQAIVIKNQLGIIPLLSWRAEF